MAKKDKFPGFEACMQMLCDPDPLTSENGYFWLLPHASQYVDELILAFHEEAIPFNRAALLDLIGQARSPKAFPLLSECLKGDDDDLREWAMLGLVVLETPEAKQLMNEAKAYTFSTVEETAAFRENLTSIQQHQRVQEEKASPVPPELGARGRSCL